MQCFVEQADKHLAHHDSISDHRQWLGWRVEGHLDLFFSEATLQQVIHAAGGLQRIDNLVMDLEDFSALLIGHFIFRGGWRGIASVPQDFGESLKSTVMVTP